MKKVLIACEESQAVCIEFRKLGIEAYSCDIQPCSGGYPDWHLQKDVFDIITVCKWDMLIAFPPCTFLSFAGNGYFNIDKYGSNALNRWFDRVKAMEFFMNLYNSNIPYIAIENPMGFPCTAFRKPDQVIEPYYFGDRHKKRTCLWLKNLPKLQYSLHNDLFTLSTSVPKPEPIYVDKVTGRKRYFTDAISGVSKNSKLLRSKTFPGIAKAMADQWSRLILIFLISLYSIV